MKRFTACFMCMVLMLSLVLSSVAFAYEGVELPDISTGNTNKQPDTAQTPDGPADTGNTDGDDGAEQPENNENNGDDNNTQNPETPEKELTADSFTDVKADDWFYDEVDYCVKNGIFDGTGETTFSPKKVLTRAEFVQVLANLEGVDVSNKDVDSGFTDVPRGKWYTPAVKWAYDEGIVDGVGDRMFAPDKPILRQEMCAILFNYMGYKSITPIKVEDKVIFTDDSEISEWAKNKVYACQMSNLVNGRGEGIFDPKTTAIRAEAATIFSEFHKNYL